MSESYRLPLAAGAAVAISLAAAYFLVLPAAAAEANAQGCPEAADKAQRPRYAELKPRPDGRPLDVGDELAALASVQHGLATTGDGSTYVWHRNNGRISGLVQPTSTFKAEDGAVCRHVVVMLTTGNKTRKVEGIACRRAHGVWSLEG